MGTAWYGRVWVCSGLVWYVVRYFLVRYGMVGFRYRLVCGTVFFWYGIGWQGSGIVWCVVRFFCMVRYGLVYKGCGDLVHKECGQTDKSAFTTNKGCSGLVYKGCRGTDRQTAKSAYTKIETQFYKLRTAPPASRVALRRPLFRREHRGLPCGGGVARSRGSGGSGGARESRCPAGHTKTESTLKIKCDAITT